MENAAQENKLFVGGIPRGTTEDVLREYFEKYGVVQEVKMPRNRLTGAFRGFAFVTFAENDAAHHAVNDSHQIRGQTVEVKKAVRRRELPSQPQDPPNGSSEDGITSNGSNSDQLKKIFVGGVPPDLVEEEFTSYFESFGTVTDAVIMRDAKTNTPRGFGFITFESADSADEVLKNNFHNLSGKRVEVKRAVPKHVINPAHNGNHGSGPHSFSYQQGGYNVAPYQQGFHNGTSHNYNMYQPGDYFGTTPNFNMYQPGFYHGTNHNYNTYQPGGYFGTVPNFNMYQPGFDHGTSSNFNTYGSEFYGYYPWNPYGAGTSGYDNGFTPMAPYEAGTSGYGNGFTPMAPYGAGTSGYGNGFTPMAPGNDTTPVNLRINEAPTIVRMATSGYNGESTSPCNGSSLTAAEPILSQSTRKGEDPSSTVMLEKSDANAAPSAMSMVGNGYCESNICSGEPTSPGSENSQSAAESIPSPSVRNDDIESSFALLKIS